LNETAAPNN
jgi:hypothetical protein